ncbi:MAG TPA: FAD-binding oxidoreductase [Candidatus Paceibacterota bacterium]
MAIWKVATLKESHMVAANVKSLTFTLSQWEGHMAGQHYDIRLTSPSGYQAERSYSAASAPEDEGIVEFGIQLLENGEVSPYLFELKAGEQIELRGPIGGHFIWDVKMPGPLVLIGGGSGMVPLVSMLRHHLKHREDVGQRDIVFLISARTIDHILYREELEKFSKNDSRLKIIRTLTDVQPKGWQGYSRRIDKEMLKETVGSLMGAMPMVYVCGPTPFVESVANNLLETGFNSHEIRTERFGGS